MSYKLQTDGQLRKCFQPSTIDFENLRKHDKSL